MSKKQIPKLDESYVFMSLGNTVDVDIERSQNAIEHSEKLLKFIHGLSIGPNQKKELYTLIASCVYAYETNSFEQGFGFGLDYPSYLKDENIPDPRTLIN